MKTQSILPVLLCFLALAPRAAVASPDAAPALEPPTAMDPGIEISLFAEHPQVVTPTGIAVDARGRVFVLENHTHFRPEDYEGPAADRILVLEDTDRDRKADRKSVFYQGLIWGTDLVFGPNGALYASTRAEIYRMRDTNADDVADEVTRIVHMETEGNYPHNGISGLCFDPGGVLHFGLGENLGEPYTMIGSDDARLSGGGEGGTFYRCQPDGSGLQRIATGIWNPFGMGFDTAGNLFATDNDPSSGPPCRLLHVVDGADFGYEFRYGRTGRHPLVTWTGEFPGSVGMVCGTGEAPCGILPYGPGRMLIASWADHRVDLHELEPDGASFSATRKPFIQGDNDFRPVHLARGPDGTFYFTDWVSSSYSLHGKGRVWSFKPPNPVPAETTDPHAEVLRAARIRSLRGSENLEPLLELLDNEDAFIRSAAIAALARSPQTVRDLDWEALGSPLRRANALVALKKSGIDEGPGHIPAALEDEDQEVRFCAVKWIADNRISKYLPLLERELQRPDISVRMFLAVMAAIDRVNGARPRDVPEPEKLLVILSDNRSSPGLRAAALRMIPPAHPKLSLKILAHFLDDPDPAIALEAVRTLQLHPDERRGVLLAGVADDPERPGVQRAEAIVGLAPLSGEFSDLLTRLAREKNRTLRAEARRALIGEPEGLVKRRRIIGADIPPTDLEAWEELIANEKGDPEAGRRIFFHSKIGTCHRCHQVEGRGIRVGPDLTAVCKIGDQRWLLESILRPNAMIAPQFLPWQITLKNDSTLLGLPLRKGGTKEAYLGLDGQEFTVKKPDILRHDELQVSLMPAGFLEQMTAKEAADLIAYLMTEK